MDGESRTTHNNKPDIILQDQSSEQGSLPLEYLREITNNFSNERLLGKGGFGSVYKGVPQNGDMIAVKKLTLTIPGTQDRQFANEVCHLMMLKHQNIVKLVGYCFETEDILVPYMGKYVYAEKSERLICLEYLPKRSLYEHLSDESSGLEWGTRYNIIEGICYGLHYLHEGPKVNTSITLSGKENGPIIHMDLKPSNILLDDNMVPKIADFGLSRLFGEEQTRMCTKNCTGTLGYMAPEYLNRGIITKKLDMFSLGVIIIEIITGRKEYPYDIAKSSQEFIELVLEKWRSRHEKALGYATQATDCQQIRRCIQIGLACVKESWEERPATFQVIEMLHRAEVEEQVRIANNHGFINSSCASTSRAAGTPLSSLLSLSWECRLRWLNQRHRTDDMHNNSVKSGNNSVLDALRVMLGIGTTQARAVELAVDYALALTARGQTRWSSAILLAGGAADAKANAAAATAASARHRQSALALTARGHRRSRKKVKDRMCELKRLVPGCRNRKLSTKALLKEAADYMEALKMQTKIMRALADALAVM